MVQPLFVAISLSAAVKAAYPGFDVTVIACAPDAVPRLVNIFTISGVLNAIFVYDWANLPPKTLLRAIETLFPIKVVNDVAVEKFSAGNSLKARQLLNALAKVVTFAVLNAGIDCSWVHPLKVALKVDAEPVFSSGTSRKEEQPENIELKSVPSSVFIKGIYSNAWQEVNIELKLVHFPVSKSGIVVNDWQNPNMLFMFVDLAVFNNGIEVSDWQLENIEAVFVELLILNKGMLCNDLQFENIEPVFVTPAIFMRGTVFRSEHSLNIFSIFIFGPFPILKSGIDSRDRHTENIVSKVVAFWKLYCGTTLRL